MSLPPIVAPLSDKMMQNVSCPISQDVMQDPVCTPDGNTYDRGNIVEWINRNHTCPLTRSPLRINDLVPNKSLKGMIDGFIRSGRLPPFPVKKEESTVSINKTNVTAAELLGFVNVTNTRPNVSNTFRLPPVAQATFHTGPLSPVDIHSFPNFDFITDIHNRRMVSSAYKVVQNMGEWDFIRRYDPSEDTGYMSDSNERINAIKHSIDEEYQGHSGASMGCTMREIQFIAKNGFNAYKQSYMRSY